MPTVPNKYRSDGEKEKFRTIGSSSDETGVATQIYGETSAGVALPLKVVDDGSGYGKLAVVKE